MTIFSLGKKELRALNAQSATFAMLNDKPYSHIIWKAIEPVYKPPLFASREEA